MRNTSLCACTISGATTTSEPATTKPWKAELVDQDMDARARRRAQGRMV